MARKARKKNLPRNIRRKVKTKKLVVDDNNRVSVPRLFFNPAERGAGWIPASRRQANE